MATTEFSPHAEIALAGQRLPVQRLRLEDLEQSLIDWGTFSPHRPGELRLRKPHLLRPHQETALADVMAGLAEAERGKLIMACGTGKTLTALRLAEQCLQGFTPWGGNDVAGGQVLFLVPSIALLAQSLREWTAHAKVSLRCFAVCSDTAVGKRTDESGLHLYDLPYPATTDAEALVTQFKRAAPTAPLTVVFATYHSIQVIAEAQIQGFPAFDLIICDEAHRTTGVTLTGKDESHFVKVHDGELIRARRRLYMTATPRLFTDAAKTQAKEHEALLCSMDDEALYGKELHRLGFGKAVSQGLLSDYKVMVLAVDEGFVSQTFQQQLAEGGELNLDDAVKITGCWNGLSKRMVRDAQGESLPGDSAPMRRAVAFARTIKDSQRIAQLFAEVVDQYTEESQAAGREETFLDCEVRHVDGTMNMLKRGKELQWLKDDPGASSCRILSNARCLAEGVDVPALDAVLFLNPRHSHVDVVQSVGRVMRTSPGKAYGYIILPIGIPAGVSPEEALKDNQKYKVVWDVLQALRAHDDRFNATINQIELNERRPEAIQVIGISGGENEEGIVTEVREQNPQYALNFPVEEWREAIFAKMVTKCGDRLYWETWAKEVATIAERHITRIKALLTEADPSHRATFEAFLTSLRKNLNPSVSEDDAIEMLAQHLITRPVFEALFAGHAFTQKNPVSQSMQAMLDTLDAEALDKERQALERFYESVRTRVANLDNAPARQTVIKELYDKFFNIAFPRMAERLGIVYTPVEVVDFILQSADDTLRHEFGVGLSEKGVHILDPFAGTGTFLVRLLQSGLIKPEDLTRKYQQELHANEIVLLAYYIAAINIEAAFHAPTQTEGVDYQPFAGMVLTDTFQSNEDEGQLQGKGFSPENSERAIRQKHLDIRVIIGNPTYSAQQSSENDGNKNLPYPHLDNRIRSTYAAGSSAQSVTSLYDSYIRAIRWASDRIKDRGVVCFVTNGSFIDANNMDGLRRCLMAEFSKVYVFNLRGNARTSGEQRRREKDNVFGMGTRTPVAITLLVKNPEASRSGQVFYHDIGDDLSREEKLDRITEWVSMDNLPWQTLIPDASHDWINQRDRAFEAFIPLGDKKNSNEDTLFNNYSRGVATGRDAWVYNFSKEMLSTNMARTITFYNNQVESFQRSQQTQPAKNTTERRQQVEAFIDNDSRKISWSRAIKNTVGRGVSYHYQEKAITPSLYRPFNKQWLYFDRRFNEMVYQMPRIFPYPKAENRVICASGIGASRDFSGLMVDMVPNLHFHDTGQCFPLYTYEKTNKGKGASHDDLFNDKEDNAIEGYTRWENIPDRMLTQFRETYADEIIDKAAIFYYIHGVLHSPEYKTRFANNLTKMLPRIPFAQDFLAFSQAGRQLAEWHLHYETVEPYPLEHPREPEGGDTEFYRVEKIRFAKPDKTDNKTTLLYNRHLTLSGIPLGAYEYIVNGKSALEWVIERYQVKTDKDSGIRNDPNDWVKEQDDPAYILNLIKRVVRVSMETVAIVKALPALNERQ